MTQPGTPGGQIPVTDLDGLARRLRDMERDIAELRANTLGVNGIVIGDRGSLRTADFDGTDFAHPGTKGVYLASESGVGKLVVNDILLRGGIIGNDALTSPVTTTSTAANTQPATFTTVANTVITSTTITVPAGFTKVTLLCAAIAAGINPGGAADNLWAGIKVSIPGGFSNGSYALPMGVQAGFSTMNAENYNVVITGLVGGQVITIQATAWTTVAGWAPSGNNIVTLNATALFTR